MENQDFAGFMEHVTLRLPDDLLQKIDAAAEKLGLTRSDYLRHIAQGVIEGALVPASSAPSSGPAGSAPAPKPKDPLRDLPTMPHMLYSVFLELNEWRVRLMAQAKSHKRLYWWFNVPPLAVNALIAAGFLYGDTIWGKILLTISTVLMGIDYLQPQGRLASAYGQAGEEVQEMRRQMELKWNWGMTKGQDQARLQEDILLWESGEEDKISRDIAKAESEVRDIGTLSKFRPMKETLAKKPRA